MSLVLNALYYKLHPMRVSMNIRAKLETPICGFFCCPSCSEDDDGRWEGRFESQFQKSQFPYLVLTFKNFSVGKGFETPSKVEVKSLKTPSKVKVQEPSLKTPREVGNMEPDLKTPNEVEFQGEGVIFSRGELWVSGVKLSQIMLRVHLSLVFKSNI